MAGQPALRRRRRGHGLLTLACPQSDVSPAERLRDRDGRVNALIPDVVDTPAVASEVPTWEAVSAMPTGGFAAAIKRQQTRLLQPEDIASAAVFLASEQSNLMTGAALVIDGGFTSQLL